MPYKTEHSIPQNDHGYTRYFRKVLSDGVSGLMGVRRDGNSEVRSLRFKANVFSPAQAQAWARSHGFCDEPLEPATARENPRMARTAKAPVRRNPVQDFQALKAVLDIDDAEKGRQMAWAATDAFAAWLDDHGDNAHAAEARDGNLDFIYSLPERTVERWWRSKECETEVASILSSGDPNAPSFLSMEYKAEFDDMQWLVHFSDRADEISRRGFKRGVDDPNTLALTTLFSEARKDQPGYNFAFLAEDAPRSGGWNKYGRYAVLFRASTGGVVVHHWGDEENQAVFWGPDAVDIHYVSFDGRTWTLPDLEDENPPEGKLDTLIAWLETRGEVRGNPAPSAAVFASPYPPGEDQWIELAPRNAWERKSLHGAVDVCQAMGRMQALVNAYFSRPVRIDGVWFQVDEAGAWLATWVRPAAVGAL